MADGNGLIVLVPACIMVENAPAVIAACLGLDCQICTDATKYTQSLGVSTGPERSGSTWLFNAIRLLYEDAEEPLDPYWITVLTDAKLQDRGCGVCSEP